MTSFLLYEYVITSITYLFFVLLQYSWQPTTILWICLANTKSCFELQDYDQFDLANEIDTLEQFLKVEVPPEETPQEENKVNFS